MPALHIACHRERFAIDPEQYIPLVCKLAIRHGAPKDSVKDSDQFSDGMTGLLKAARHFDPTLGNQFITYAWTSIERQINHESYRLHKLKYAPPPMRDGCNGDDFEGRELDPAITAERVDLCRRLFKGIAARDRYVVEQTIMQGRTQRDVARELGFTKTRCEQICKRALNRMRAVA